MQASCVVFFVIAGESERLSVRRRSSSISSTRTCLQKSRPSVQGLLSITGNRERGKEQSSFHFGGCQKSLQEHPQRDSSSSVFSSSCKLPFLFLSLVVGLCSDRHTLHSSYPSSVTTIGASFTSSSSSFFFPRLLHETSLGFFLF